MWVADCFDTNVDVSLEDLEGDTQQRYGTVALWVPQWLSGLGIATISVLLYILEMLSWRMEEVVYVVEGGSELLGRKGARDTFSLMCWDFP